MKEINYEDRLLLRLRREYSKDEVVNAISIALSKKEQEVGELLSEIDFLKEEIESYKKDTDLKKEERKALKREDLYQNLLQQNKRVLAEVKRIRHEKSELVTRCYYAEQKVKDYGK
jgi:hypothetical protein